MRLVPLLLLLGSSSASCTSSAAGPTPAADPKESAVGVGPSSASPPRVEPSSATTGLAAGVAPPASPGDAARPAALDRARYGWLEDADVEATETLEARFSPPSGFARVRVEPKTFGAFLRGLPVAAAGTPVLAYDGRTILAAGDPNLAAVVTLDVGKADLQQCADSVIRLHAEWRWSDGARDHDYKAASGSPMPLSRYLSGERPIPDGAKLRWEKRSKALTATRRAFRTYLDAVFMFANTGSLARDATKVARADLRAGDFFVLAGNPGHAVLVLDVARTKDGKTRALLGQGYMPAQRFHVLRASKASPWYALDDEAGVQTPFWPAPFPWSSLRRLD